MAKIYIDNSRYMEFIDDVATIITELQFRDDAYKEIKDGLSDDTCIVFTDEAQDLYNDTYDLIEGLLNRNLNIHSNNELINDN